jgi:hypothetical protein
METYKSSGNGSAHVQVTLGMLNRIQILLKQKEKKGIAHHSSGTIATHDILSTAIHGGDDLPLLLIYIQPIIG